MKKIATLALICIFTFAKAQTSPNGYSTNLVAKLYTPEERESNSFYDEFKYSYFLVDSLGNQISPIFTEEAEYIGLDDSRRRANINRILQKNFYRGIARVSSNKFIRSDGKIVMEANDFCKVNDFHNDIFFVSYSGKNCSGFQYEKTSNSAFISLKGEKIVEFKKGKSDNKILKGLILVDSGEKKWQGDKTILTFHSNKDPYTRFVIMNSKGEFTLIDNKDGETIQDAYFVGDSKIVLQLMGYNTTYRSINLNVKNEDSTKPLQAKEDQFASDNPFPNGVYFVFKHEIKFHTAEDKAAYEQIDKEQKIFNAQENAKYDNLYLKQEFQTNCLGKGKTCTNCSGSGRSKELTYSTRKVENDTQWDSKLQKMVKVKVTTVSDNDITSKCKSCAGTGQCSTNPNGKYSSVISENYPGLCID